MMMKSISHNKFTIIIPTRNRTDVAFALVSYLRETLGAMCPIIVVDQSDDRGEGLERLLNGNSRLDLLHVYQACRGTSTARNLGAKHAGTDWLVFLDDDVRPAKEYLEALSYFIADNRWADVVQGTTEDAAAWEEYCECQLERMSRRDENRDLKAVSHGWSAIDRLLKARGAGCENLIIGIKSGNFAISRRAFLGAGGFDEQIEGVGEDSEFGLRLWWLGYRACQSPQVVAFHLCEGTGGTRELKKSRIRQLFDPDPSPGLVYFYLKWFPAEILRLLVSRHLNLMKCARRPWLLPVRVVRLFRSLAAAKRRIRVGPLYVSVPQPRSANVQKSGPFGL